MRKIFFLFFILSAICNTTGFSREKIKEDSNGIAYIYSDWKDFYGFLISSTKKDTYKYAYLFNGNDGNLFGDSDFQPSEEWQLFSAKILSEGSMMEIFAVLSPNAHQTCLILSNNFSFGDIKHHIATKNEDYIDVFLYEVESAFDEQLCFFDEDVPLKLLDFNEVKKPPKNWDN